MTRDPNPDDPNADLAQQFEALAKGTMAQAAQIDLSETIAQQVSKLEPTWRFAHFAVPAMAILIFVGVQWWRHHTPAITAEVDAPAGAIVSHDKDSESVQGIGIALTSPFGLETTDEQHAALRLEGRTLQLYQNTRIHVSAAGTLTLDTGRVDMTSTKPHPVQCQAAQLLTKGRVAIEHRRKGPHQMQLLGRHKIAAASAVLVIAVYAGWTTIKTSEGDVRVDAPGGAFVDENGEAHRFGLHDGLVTSAASGLASLSAQKGDLAKEEASAGAFWSDEQQVVLFRVPGEVFDAQTGEPLDGFDLVAEPVHSKDYHQTRPVNQNFKNLDEGHFELSGVGIGSWRITARRPGYAPVIQTLVIDDLTADPYLVIPLSSGAQVSGRVVDWRGESVAGATIGLTQCFHGSGDEDGCELAKTGQDGTFVLSKVPEDEVYSLYAKHERYGFATSKNLTSLLGDEVGSGQHITIALSGIVRIYGHVTRGTDEVPVAAAVVEGGGKKVQADSSGFYELKIPLEERPEAYVASYPNAPKGRARIESYPQNRSARSLQWVNATSHAAEVEIDFHLEMSQATLHGQIRDRNGPIAGVDLRLANTNGWAKQRTHQTFPTLAVTDKDGHYIVSNIPAEAGYEVSFRRSTKDRWQTLGYVNIPDETDIEANFRIGSGSIRGRFVSATGNLVAVAEFSCGRMGAERTGIKNVFILPHCYPDGRFEFVDLMPGRYVLHNKVEWMGGSVDFKEKQVVIADGQVLNDVEVEIEGEPATTWRFRVLNSENEFLSGAYIRYTVGKTMMTMNLQTQDDGTATQQLSDGIKEISLEVPGHVPQEVVLDTHKADQVIEVHLSRTKGQESSEESPAPLDH